MINNSKHFLPDGYLINQQAAPFADIPGVEIYQPDVYRLSAHIFFTGNFKFIIDVGCGNGLKWSTLTNVDSKCLIGIDVGDNLKSFRENNTNAKSINFDLNNGLPNIDLDTLYQSVIVCSDAIEHLMDPAPLMKALAYWSKHSPFILCSTPARDRARGVGTMGPPANQCHVREWSLDEFCRSMNSHGFIHGHAGYTTNCERMLAKTTSLIIGGKHAQIPSNQTLPETLAIISTFNEEDCIAEVVRNFINQGIRVHVIDNWSTDSTWDILSAASKDSTLLNLERYPSEPDNQYDWHGILQRKEQIAAAQPIGTWILHTDADEIRVSPWPQVRLIDAIAAVDSMGYNAIDYTVLDFRFTNNDPVNQTRSLEDRLCLFEFGRRGGHFSQIKTWKNMGYSVNISESGGHTAEFQERKVYPWKFILKHYPLRGIFHARDKVFKHRKPRFESEQSTRGWHSQYNNISQTEDIRPWSARALIPWHPYHTYQEHLVELSSGIGVPRE